MELSLWANHPKDQPSLSFRDRTPQPISMRGDELPLLTVKTKLASDYYRRHPKTYIRCQSHAILGLSDGAASPLLIPLDQNYNSQGIPHVSSPRPIAFNSHGANLLAAFPAFTVSTTSSFFLLCQPIMSYNTTLYRICQGKNALIQI